jgi:hypothetical protein
MILVGGKYRYILKDILLVSLMTSLSSSYVFWHASRSLAWILSVQCADLLCFVPLPGKFGILEHWLPQFIKVQSVLLSQSPLRNLAELPYFRGEAAVHEQIIASFASHHIVENL